MESQMLMGYLPDGVVIRIIGQGTMHQSPAFRAAAEMALETGRLVCDMTECEYLDSTFLGCLIGVQKRAESMPHATFVVAADARQQLKLFSTSSLDRYFDFTKSKITPVGDMVAIEGADLDLEELGNHVLACHQRLAERGGKDAEAFRRVCQRLSAELEGRISGNT